MEAIGKDKKECESFQDGILKQGLYTAVIEYWDYLRKLHVNFFDSDRDNATIKRLLDNDNYFGANNLQSLYFKSALTVLVDKLQDDINDL